MSFVVQKDDTVGQWPVFGTWRPVVLDGKKTARLSCPGCGSIALLDHKIDKEGNVTPSVVCPIQSCDFHEFVKLEGWP